MIFDRSKVPPVMNMIISEVVADGSWVMGEVMEWSEMEAIYARV